MTAVEITKMVSENNFPDSFTEQDKNQIKAMWNSGDVRGAQQMVQQLLEAPYRDKTLL